MSEVGDEWWWAGKEQGSEKRFHSLARVKMTNNEIASIVFHISKEELLLKDMFYLCKWRNEPKACLMTIRFMKKKIVLMRDSNGDLKTHVSSFDISFHIPELKMMLIFKVLCICSMLINFWEKVVLLSV